MFQQGPYKTPERQLQTLTAGKEKSLTTAQSEQRPAALQEGTWACWWAVSSSEPCVPWQQAGSTSWAAQRGPGPGELSPPSQHLSDHTDPVLRTACPTTRQTGASSGKSHHDSQGSEHFPTRRSRGNQAHSAWRKKDFSIMTAQYKLLKTKPSCSLWSMDGG